jgi:UDP-hydrolysing UDP-N-acetyl-D-glucosamine 2-epimerase
MKKIAWVTTQRSELNASRYVIQALRDDPEFDLSLITGWIPKGEIDMPAYYIRNYDARDFQTACFNLSHVLRDVSGALLDIKPDMLILNGDRVELVPIALAANLRDIPIALIGDGEITDGSRDNLYRYALSRFAHLHLVSDHYAAKNLIQSGEQPERVHIVGQCGLENVARTPKLSLEETSKAIGLDLSIPTALCIYYPSIEPKVNYQDKRCLTVQSLSVEGQINPILSALDRINQQTVFVQPCAELESNTIINAINEYCWTHDNCKAFTNLENQLFQSLMQQSAFMIGNSSCGVIEYPFTGHRTINIGSRQSGRQHYPSVINTVYDVDELVQHIKEALGSADGGMVLPDDLPSKRIVQVIKENIEDPNLLFKKILLGG